MLQQSSPSQVDLLHGILERRSKWLRDQGIDLSHQPYPKAFLVKDLASQRVWHWEEQGRILGLIRVLKQPPSYYPSDVWTDADPVWYLAQLAVDSEAQGRRVGEHILQAVEAMAREHGIRGLRGNVVLPNKKLVQYYLDQGFDLMDERWCFNQKQGSERRYGFLEKRL